MKSILLDVFERQLAHVEVGSAVSCVFDLSSQAVAARKRATLAADCDDMGFADM